MHDFETKYVASNSVAAKTRSWMWHNFLPDPAYPEAIISSIYFDTPDFYHLKEKDESEHFKSKYRIRWYSDIKTKEPLSNAFFEVKLKIGENRFKKRVMNESSFHDIDLNSDVFFNHFRSLNSFTGYFPGHLFPAIQINYTRTRYIDPLTKLRLCVDSDIHIKRIGQRIIQRQFKPNYLTNCVLEVKGPSAIAPKRLTNIEYFGFKKNSFSKYESCFTELIRN